MGSDGMKVAIVGFGSQGKSSLEYWLAQGADVTVIDANDQTEVPEGVQSRLGHGCMDDIDEYDVIVRAPIVHPKWILAVSKDPDSLLPKITSNTNEFFRVCPTKNIIGVTGTKGKGTTSTLIAHMLKTAGKRVHLGGNIGIPPLELLNENIQPEDWVVLELANFQLIDLKHLAHIAVCVMVNPEHLDWHEDFEEYIAAKQQMFIHQNENNIAVYYSENKHSESIADASPGKQIPYMKPPGAYVENDTFMVDGQEICKTSESKLPGKHNWQNVCAALTAVWQITQDKDALRRAIIEFSSLPYRIELRREIDGIRYYNDSFATGVGATVAAIEAIDGFKIMILGGFDRGLVLDELAENLVIRENEIRKVVLIGASADRLAEVLTKHGFTNYVHCPAKTMPEVVDFAKQQAQPGDAVVLSPAFASFDMFKNFEERGNRFNEAVEAL